MDPRTATTLLLAVTITMLVGCETPKTNSQKRMGDATRATVQLMVDSTHTADGTPREPIVIDGATAEMIFDNYLENETSFEQRQRIEGSGIIQVDQTQ